MNEVEKALLAEVTGDAEPKLCLCTKTMIDAGRWWRGTQVWLCVLQDELILLAVARRRYVQRVALADCSGSYYFHATGELVIAPAEGIETNRISLSPFDALRVLDALGVKQVLETGMTVNRSV